MNGNSDSRKFFNKGARLRKRHRRLVHELTTVRNELFAKIGIDVAGRAKIRALTDKGAHLQGKIVQCEQELRALRNEFLIRGRPDVARHFIVTPLALRDLAGALFRGETPVLFRKKIAVENAPMARNFLAKFSLEYRDGEQGLLWRGDDGEVRRATEARLDNHFWTQFTELLSEALIEKLRSNFRERVKVARKKGRKDLPSLDDEMRELTVAMAQAYPLEEWSGIFPDATLAGQVNFIKDIIAGHSHAPSETNLPGLRVALFWRGFEPIGFGDVVPPLRHWSDKSACEFDNFFSKQELKLSNYQARKSRFGLRSQAPTLVTYAEYKCNGKTHLLNCER